MGNTIVTALLIYLTIGSMVWVVMLTIGAIENIAAVNAHRKGLPLKSWMLWVTSVFVMMTWPMQVKSLFAGLLRVRG